MRCLDLFCGTKSIGKAFLREGFEVVTSDIDSEFCPDICGNILSWDRTWFGDRFDVIWASPPCQGFTVATIGRNWEKATMAPKTDTARMGIRLALKTLEIIDYYKPRYFFIENPRGMLRKMDFMSHLKRNTITYCQYGDSRMKPTDIWYSEWPEGMPVRCCKNGDDCHERAPRGTRRGTQGLNNAVERARIPDGFCSLLAKSIKSIPWGVYHQNPNRAKPKPACFLGERSKL